MLHLFLHPSHVCDTYAINFYPIEFSSITLLVLLMDFFKSLSSKNSSYKSGQTPSTFMWIYKKNVMYSTVSGGQGRMGN